MSLPDPAGLGLPDLGGRLRLVGQLPTTVATLVVLAVVLSGAPASDPSWARLASSVTSLGAEEVAWLAVGVVVLTVLLHPLQRGLVRLLEGYPLLRGPGALVGHPMRRRWERRLDRLSAAQRKERPSADEMVRMKRSAAVLRHLPERDRLMPTRLGNALRAAEDEAHTRFGVATVVVWPMLYPLVSDKLGAGLRDARDRLDLAARFAATFMLTAIACVVLLISSLAAIPIAGALLVLAILSYRGAVAAAVTYGELINAAVALHRFDLLAALHLPLPATPTEERETHQHLARLLRNRAPNPTITYLHPHQSH